MNLDAARFLDDVTGRYARSHFEAVHALFVATVAGDRVEMAVAREQLEHVMGATMGAAEILGASIVLRRAAGAYAHTGTTMRGDVVNAIIFAQTPIQSILPHVALTDAADDMVARTPVTIRRAAERTAEAISRLYGSGRVVAFAKAAEQTVTEAAQRFIVDAFAEGIPEGEAGRRLAMTVEKIREKSAAWSESYARMVFRTNVNTAVTAGRFRQSQDPDIKRVLPAFRLDTVGDVDTRPNHQAADGIIMSVDNPEWRRIAPPLGYNCRCDIVAVNIMELEALGRIDAGGNVIDDRVPAGAHPDEGFRHGGRPDLMLAAR